METMSLKTWLTDIGLSHITEALADFGITTTKDLSIQREDDLNEIIKELDLKPRQRIKFKVAVRKLEVEDQPRSVLTSGEEIAIKNLLSLTKAAKLSLVSIENTLEVLGKNCTKARAEISNEFREHRKQLQQREARLLADLRAKEKEKRIQLEKQCLVLTGAIAQFAQAKIDSDRILNVASIESMQNRTDSVAAKIAGVSKVRFPTKAATNPHVKYERDQQAMMQTISDYGNVATYSDMKPPTITGLEEGADSIQVSWKVAIEPGAPKDTLPVGFAIRVSELSPTSTVSGVGREGQVYLDAEYECEGKEDSYLIKDLKMDTDYRIFVKVKSKFGWTSYGPPSTGKTMTLTAFQDSCLLDQKSATKLIEFIGGYCESSLLYRASRDGFAGKDFHKHCDRKGPTVVVIKRTGSETIYGGYTPLNWTSPDPRKYYGDDQLRSFLFTMSDENGRPSKYKLKRSKADMAILCRKNWGPTFGAGCDLRIYNNSNTETNSYTNPSSYEVPSRTALCGQYTNYTITEIEVFSIYN